MITTLNGIVNFVTGVFTGDWKKAWDGIKGIFEGVFDGLKGTITGTLNVIIDALNGLIRGANHIQINAPDWVPGLGGKSFGIDIPEIPKLANGGLVSAPTLAMVGDNRNAQADPEVVSPLSKLQGMLGGNNQEVVAAINELAELIKNLQTPIVMKVGETEFARLIVNLLNEASRRAGRTLLNV
jgi:hypothetical protein